MLLAINPDTGTAMRIHSRDEAKDCKADGWKLLVVSNAAAAASLLSIPCAQRVTR
jgi:hypothetical protein